MPARIGHHLPQYAATTLIALTGAFFVTLCFLILLDEVLIKLLIIPLLLTVGLFTILRDSPHSKTHVS